MRKKKGFLIKSYYLGKKGGEGIAECLMMFSFPVGLCIWWEDLAPWDLDGPGWCDTEYIP